MPFRSSPSMPQARHPGRRWSRAGQEPALSEVLADPLVHLVMRRDGVSRAELDEVIARAQAKLRGELCCQSCPAA